MRLLFLMTFILTGCLSEAPKRATLAESAGVDSSESRLLGDWDADPSGCGQVQCTPMGVRFTSDQIGYFRKDGNTITFVSGGMRPYRVVGNGSLFVDVEGYVDYSISNNGQRLRLCQNHFGCTDFNR